MAVVLSLRIKFCSSLGLSLSDSGNGSLSVSLSLRVSVRVAGSASFCGRVNRSGMKP